MTKDLERDLGLVAVVAVSMGAMIGSGIFILPGLAMAEAGPAVILAFLVAGILVIPAALSISELGTAMPEAGGDYVFIERGMGPGVGTIAGLGTWLTLLFKGALALVGGMYYLDVIFALPNLTATAVVLATVLIGVNLIGVKQTGQLQSWMVVVMVAILAVFISVSILQVDGASYDPFFTAGGEGVISAIALVIVSYAGVTKVASVAEEIENPGRNLPLGLLISLAITTLLYVLIVFVLVGIVDAETLRGTNIPMVVAVDPLFGTLGVVAIVLAAILALISTANAGILTASRYPLALSRDDLIPDVFSRVHSNFQTPHIAILVTGGVMLFIIISLPVQEIAKMASAFQILVYGLVNAALIAFRERDLEWYSPDFKSPGYPWVQLFGVVSAAFIITQMDVLPLVGAVGITVVGGLWYLYYVRGEVDREGIAVDAVRREAGRQYVAETERKIAEPKGDEIMLALRRDVSRLEENRLLEIAAPIARSRNSRIRVIRFDEVPDQYPLDQAVDQSAEDVEFEQRTDELAREIDAPVEVGEIVSHDTKHAIVNYAERAGVDLILTRADPVSRLRTLFGRDADWIMERAPCDVAFVQLGKLERIDEIAIVTDRSPFNDPLKVELADAIAQQSGGRIRFVFPAGEDASEQVLDSIRAYHDELNDLCSSPVEGTIIEGENARQQLIAEVETADLVMLSTKTHKLLPDLVFTRESDRIATRLDQPVVMVHSSRSRRATFLEPIVERLLFREENRE
ncbi:amino acid transporter [Halalkaliarchaeum desulfuricum]|uniref:Amino acid transporter n=1 Tax=Halalkaliarchaeum desulfuricum TaxID=2055893 RepID=A0A343THM4_9EURY|nr:universal stress protein [Halalkaliarchaeum desulfuricum]AUX08596.1 amino acid transporter [Halalkaliarchaeum desulfuricum]